MIQSVCYSHYRYGVGILEDKEKLEIGQSIFAILEQQGAQALSKAFPDHVKIYFIQVDPDQLDIRMRKSGDSEVSIQQ